MKLGMVALTALSICGVLETFFIAILSTDACHHLIKNYPGATLAIIATLLSLLITLAGFVAWILRKMARKSDPAVEAVFTGPGRFLP